MNRFLSFSLLLNFLYGISYNQRIDTQLGMKLNCTDDSLCSVNTNLSARINTTQKSCVRIFAYFMKYLKPDQQNAMVDIAESNNSTDTCFDWYLVKPIFINQFKNINNNFANQYTQFSKNLKNSLGCINAMTRFLDSSTKNNLMPSYANIINTISSYNSGLAFLIKALHTIRLNRTRFFSTKLQNISNVIVNTSNAINSSIPKFIDIDVELQTVAQAYINFTLSYLNLSQNFNDEYNNIINFISNSSQCLNSSSTSGNSNSTISPQNLTNNTSDIRPNSKYFLLRFLQVGNTTSTNQTTNTNATQLPNTLVPNQTINTISYQITSQPNLPDSLISDSLRQILNQTIQAAAQSNFIFTRDKAAFILNLTNDVVISPRAKGQYEDSLLNITAYFNAIQMFNSDSNVSRNLFCNQSSCTYQTSYRNSSFTLNFKPDKNPKETWFTLMNYGPNKIYVSAYYYVTSKGKFIQIISFLNGKPNKLENPSVKKIDSQVSCLNTFGKAKPTQGFNSQLRSCFSGNDICIKNITSFCQQSRLFDMVNNFLCPNLLPVECDLNLAPIYFGTNWTTYCGIWVNSKLMLPDNRVDIGKILSLCKIVNDSNTDFYNNHPSRRRLQTSTDLGVVSSNSDPTSNYTITSSEADSTTNSSVLNVDGSTSTSTATYSSSDYNKIDESSLTIDMSGSANSNSCFYVLNYIMCIIYLLFI